MAGVRRMSLVRSVVVACGVGALVWAAAPPRHLRYVPQLFTTGDACMACHNGLSTASGEDVSIGTNWRATMMANSARDPYWQASVRRETIDHPTVASEIEDECAKCHMPMARAQAHAEGRHLSVFANLPIGASASADAALAADGVSCTLCHQVLPDKLGTSASLVGGFVVDTVTPFGTRRVFGQHQVDSGRVLIMHSSSQFVPTQGLHLKRSELCATCHTLITEARDSSGRVVGRLPEQMPYQEWLNSRFAQRQSCQDCHMPVVAESTAISGVWGRQRPSLARHDFRGGNFFLLSMLGKYRAELGVDALASELTAAAARTREHLAHETAALTIEDAAVQDDAVLATIAIRNLSGHKFPTAYPSRRLWVHVTVRSADGQVLFESGALRTDGSIVGNANDDAPGSFEPHYLELSSPDQVQIYESITVDGRGAPTTSLLAATAYAKDNRLLPDGFQKASAPADIAVHGTASDDPDFGGGGDVVRLRAAVRGGRAPYTVEAELLFQPVGYRWAMNLDRYGVSETERFVRYYRTMAASSATRIGVASRATR